MKLPYRRECPFCGVPDPLIERESVCVYRVRCDSCGAAGPPVEEWQFESGEQEAQAAAAARWNRRVIILHEPDPMKET